jgi:hypothetical protein
MIASTLYRQTSGAKKASTFLKHVNGGPLAVVLFIALAVLPSIGNTTSDKRSSAPSYSLSVSHPAEDEPYLSLDLGHLFSKTVWSIKDAVNDAALIEYAKAQGIDIPDPLTTPCPNTSQPISVRSKSVSSQAMTPSSSY